MPHAHWSELIWFAFAMVGFVITTLSLTSALGDRRYWRERDKIHPIPPERLQMSAFVVTGARFIFIAHLFVLVASVAALFLEPPPPPYRDIMQSAIGIFCWIGLSGVLSAYSWWGKIIRQRISSGTYSGKETPQRRIEDGPR